MSELIIEESFRRALDERRRRIIRRCVLVAAGACVIFVLGLLNDIYIGEHRVTVIEWYYSPVQHTLKAHTGSSAGVHLSN